MSLKKGDIVVITGDRRGKFVCPLPYHWPFLYGEIGVVLSVDEDWIEVYRDRRDYPCYNDDPYSFNYKNSELEYIDHIPEKNWAGLNLEGF